jgi:MoaA/NifB/PqqE/SkfB family radical SAM enzyme
MPIVNFQTWEFCELNCKFCLYVKTKKLTNGWRLKDFRVAADKLIESGIDRFDMTPSLGEITLDPTWIDKLKYIDGRVDYIQVYTHGLNLKKSDLRTLMNLKSPLTLVFSVYGDSPRTYKDTTGHDEFNKFMSVLTQIKEVTPLPANKRIGFDIRFQEIEMPMHITNVDFKNHLWRELLLLNGLSENIFILNKWENSNWGVKFPNLPNAKEMPKLEKACDCMNVTLNPNGDAVICDICYPYDKRFEILGNILTDDVATIYNRLNEIIEEMDNGEFPSVCKNCTEYTCTGDEEDYFDGAWKTRPKRMWHEDSSS